MSKILKIALYPFKSLPGYEVREAVLSAYGPLEGDRFLSLWESEGMVWNAKRSDRFHLLRTQWKPQPMVWAQSISPCEIPMQAGANYQKLETWFSDFFNRELTIRYDDHLSFPDDAELPGPTLIGSATLDFFAEQLGLSSQELFERLRVNIVFETQKPFEDELYLPFASLSNTLKFGDAELCIENCCRRCIVPCRELDTGKLNKKFVQKIGQIRKQFQPKELPLENYKPLFRLALNTSVVQAGRIFLDSK